MQLPAAVALACLLLAVSAGVAAAAGPPPPPLPPLPRQVAVGAFRFPSRPSRELRACAIHEAVCVHAQRGTNPLRMSQVLETASRTLLSLRALGLPAPLPDGVAGGSPALDLYLGAASADRAEVDVDGSLPSPGFDGAPAFVRLGETDTSTCGGRSLVARAVIEAGTARLDAGAEPGARALVSAYLGSLVEPCDEAENAGVDAFQRTPERALVSRASLSRGEVPGISLFAQHLEDQYSGLGAPGGFVTSLLAIAGQRTPPASSTWLAEPDVFDALRSSLDFRRATLDDLLLDFAVARGFVGDRSDEQHLAGSGRFGRAGRVRFEWTIPVATLPRRLAPLRGVEPTGSTYLWLDLASEASNKALSLSFVAEWELPCVFEWAIVKIDKEGREVARTSIVVQHGATRADKALVVDASALSGLLVVGVNAGGLQRDLPYDPDDPAVGHGYEVTLRRD